MSRPDLEYMIKFLSNIGPILRATRENLYISRAKLAKELNIAETTILKIEKGKSFNTTNLMIVLNWINNNTHVEKTHGLGR